MNLFPFRSRFGGAVVALASVFVVGCGEQELEQPLEPVATVTSALSVEEAVTAGCSTAQLKALSLQIIAQGNCNEPDAFTELPDIDNVNQGSAVLPYLEEPARDALVAALASNPSQSMQINSMLRTVPQQYLLYRWYQLGICGIGLAASPGNSNHETGLAIDIQQYNEWKSALDANGFSWLGAGRPGSLRLSGRPAPSTIRGLDVLAFQQLWNLNHPEDIITEDGDYGPQTESRLKQAPAEGFVVGPDCGGGGSWIPLPPPQGGSVAISARFTDAGDPLSDGPSSAVTDLFAGRDYTLQIDLQNTVSSTSKDVTANFTLPTDLLLGAGFSLQRNTAGSFEPMVVPSGNPAANVVLPAEFQLELGDLLGGEIIRVLVPVRARKYSLTEAPPATLKVVADKSQQNAAFRYLRRAPL